MVNFWINLTQGKDSKLSMIMYILLLNLNNSSEYESPWIKTVQNILYESGLSNVWHFPNVVNDKWLDNCLKIFMMNIFKHGHQMYFTMINVLPIEYLKKYLSLNRT